MNGAEKIKVSGKFRAVLLLITTIIFLVGSVLIWSYVNRSVEEQRKTEFLRVVEKTTEEASTSISEVVERLYDLRGFLSSGEIDSIEWKNFMQAAGIENENQGIYTFAYAPRIERKDLSKYLAEVKLLETDPVYKDYAVFPTTKNAELFPLRYLYTTDTDLKALLGYDLGTSENQVTALTQSVFGDTPILTDWLHLGLVISGNTKTGYVVMLPVYSRADINKFPKEQRKQYLKGLVGAWIFPEGLVSEMEKTEIMNAGNVRLTVYDGKDLLFSVGEKIGGKQEMEELKEVVLLNKSFRFDFVTTGTTLLPSFTANLPWLTAIGLLVINLMWMTTVTFILIARREAATMAEEATKDLRKFKQAVEGVSDHVVITDTNGVILYANKAAEKITGYKREVMIGKKPSLWGRQMEVGFYKRFWKTIKEAKKPFWGELVNKRKNGEIYEAEINVSPILDDKGKLLFFVGIERDLTRVRAMEKMKTEFIALASHQLRTPLSAVKWFGKMLISGEAGKLTPTQKEYVERVYESNEREISLVNSLLNVSRIESGKILVMPKPTDLINLVETVILDFRAEADKGHKKLRVFLGKKVPEMMVDGDLVRHVYTNLIANAIRYTKEGGKILVKVYLNKGSVVSEVKDDGIGIPKGEQKRVFEKFFRASNALKKETDGNGLGLYLAKTIVESSGGKIGFRSVEGKWSTFWFTLPIKISKKK
jgi:PAS domain S-box-containing protein